VSWVGPREGGGGGGGCGGRGSALRGGGQPRLIPSRRLNFHTFYSCGRPAGMTGVGGLGRRAEGWCCPSQAQSAPSTVLCHTAAAAPHRSDLVFAVHTYCRMRSSPLADAAAPLSTTPLTPLLPPPGPSSNSTSQRLSASPSNCWKPLPWGWAWPPGRCTPCLTHNTPASSGSTTTPSHQGHPRMLWASLTTRTLAS